MNYKTWEETVPDYMTQVIRLLLTMVPQQRGYKLKEGQAVYEIDSVLKKVPLPDVKRET